MADVSPTAADVVMVSGSDKKVTFGATITAGAVLYFDTTAGEGDYKLAQCDGTALEAGSADIVIALNGGADGQPGRVAALNPGDVVNVGATLTEGEIYVLSQAAGAMCPEADIVTADDYVTVLGVGNSDGNLVCIGLYTGAQIPT